MGREERMAEATEQGRPTKKRTWPTRFATGVFFGLAFSAWLANHVGASIYDIVLSLSTMWLYVFILFLSGLLFRLAWGGWLSQLIHGVLVAGTACLAVYWFVIEDAAKRAAPDLRAEYETSKCLLTRSVIRKLGGHNLPTCP
jgi:hypothetical protein